MKSAITTFSSFPAISSATQVPVPRNIAGNIHPRRGAKRARLSFSFPISPIMAGSYIQKAESCIPRIHWNGIVFLVLQVPIVMCFLRMLTSQKNSPLRGPRCGVENDSLNQQITK